MLEEAEQSLVDVVLTMVIRIRDVAGRVRGARVWRARPAAQGSVLTAPTRRARKTADFCMVYPS